MHLIVPTVDPLIDLRYDLPPHHGLYEAHESIRVPQISMPDRLHYDQKGIVNLVICVLRS
jgi:hypothetical protein